MVLKALPIVPLETIYEEPTSSIQSRASSHSNLNQSIINGLISSRSIPSVDIERQRIYENKISKLPIEVQFRDGTKRFIHPSATPTMVISRKNLLNSSKENLSPKKLFHTKRPLVVTIITAEDLRQAGITSTLTPSTSGSDLSIRSHSQANSPFVRIKSLEDINEALRKSTTITPVAENSIERFASSAIQALPPDNENENTSILYTGQSAPVTSTTTTTIVHTKPSTAFRPVFKPIPFNIQPVPIRPKVSSALISKPNQSIQQQNFTHPAYYQPNITFISYQAPTNSSTYSYNSSAVSNEPSIQLTSNLQTLLQTNYQPYSPQYPTYPTPTNQSYSNYQWQTINPNSFYDIARLSKQYSNIPLDIILPASQVQNQELVLAHNPVLERQLLNAGLSPETVGLYERVLDIAKARQQMFS